MLPLKYCLPTWLTPNFLKTPFTLPLIWIQCLAAPFPWKQPTKANSTFILSNAVVTSLKSSYSTSHLLLAHLTMTLYWKRSVSQLQWPCTLPLTLHLVSSADSSAQSLNAGESQDIVPSPLLLLKVHMIHSDLILSQVFKYHLQADKSQFLSPALTSSLSYRFKYPTAYLIPPLEYIQGVSNLTCPKQNTWFHSSPALVYPSPQLLKNRNLKVIFAFLLFFFYYCHVYWPLLLWSVNFFQHIGVYF